MKTLTFILGLLLCAPALAGDKQAISQLLAGQAAAWNRGDLNAFMAPYWHSKQLRFASGGTVTYGWQATLNHYRARYQNRKAMGQLVFQVRDIKLLGQHALVFGHWLLNREKDQPQGLFTLLLAKRKNGKWQIVADHTSSAH